VTHSVTQSQTFCKYIIFKKVVQLQTENVELKVYKINKQKQNLLMKKIWHKVPPLEKTNTKLNIIHWTVDKINQEGRIATEIGADFDKLRHYGHLWNVLAVARVGHSGFSPVLVSNRVSSFSGAMGSNANETTLQWVSNTCS